MKMIEEIKCIEDTITAIYNRTKGGWVKGSLSYIGSRYYNLNGQLSGFIARCLKNYKLILNSGPDNQPSYKWNPQMTLPNSTLATRIYTDYELYCEELRLKQKQKRAKDPSIHIKDMSDEALALELRARGYEVTATKIIKL